MSIADDEVPYEDPDYPLGDWIYEVVNHNTRLGYDEWVCHQREAEDGLNKTLHLTNNTAVTEEKK